MLDHDPLDKAKVCQILHGASWVYRDSHTLRGCRTVGAGRVRVRAALSRAALAATKRNAVIRAPCARLVASGKPQNLTRTGAMRKLLTILNAMARNDTRSQEGASAATA